MSLIFYRASLELLTLPVGCHIGGCNIELSIFIVWTQLFIILFQILNYTFTSGIELHINMYANSVK
jgi:hypothetical protein